MIPRLGLLVVNMGISPNPTIADSQLNTSPTTLPTSIPQVQPTGKAAGNALIVIPGVWQGEVWLMSFQTGIYTQFENNQVHRGMSWFPIRQSEMFVTFSLAWPLISSNNSGSFQSMQAFQNALRQHQQNSALVAGNPAPMQLTYYNNTGTGNNKSQLIDNNLPLGNSELLLKQAQNITTGNLNSQGVAIQPFDAKHPLQQLSYQGWIQSVDKQYTRFKSIYLMNYRMNIINPRSQVSNLITNTSTGTAVPTALTVKTYGLNYINANTSNGSGIDISKITGTAN